MVIYLITFILSCLFFSFATKTRGVVRFLWLSVSILIPSMLAGLRDESIGTDMGTYGISAWQEACCSSSLENYILGLTIAKGSMEIGYLIMNWAVSRITNDIHFYMFFHQFFVLLFVLGAYWRLRKKIIPFMSLLIYFLFIYNMSLSMLRQMLAIAILMYGITYLLDNKKPKKRIFYGCCGFALLFHNSVIFIILIPLCKYLVSKFGKHMGVIYLCSIIGVIFIAVMYQSLLSSLMEYGIVSAKYEMYMDQEGYKSHKINLLVEAMLLGSMFIFIKLVRKENRDDQFCKLVQLLLLLSLCMELLGGIVETATRVVYYLILISCLYFPLSSCDIRFKRYLSCAFCFSMLLMFVYVSLERGVVNADTIPYTSKILGIE